MKNVFILGPMAQATLVFHDLTDFMPGPPQLHAKPFVGVAYQGKDIVLRFIIEYSS